MTSSRSGRRRVDWDDVRARLARLEAIATASAELPADQVERVLAERARALARPAPGAEGERPPSVELLFFELAGRRYAIESRFVVEVARLQDLTPVPGAPTPVLGVCAFRGAVVPVVDLRRFLESGEPGLNDLSQLVVLGDPSPELGLLADRLLALEPRDWTELENGPRPGVENHVAAIVRDGTVVLDARSILDDPRLVSGADGAT